MRKLRMLVGPRRGQVREFFDHEAGAAIASGFAEEIVDEAPPPAPAAPPPAPAKKTARRGKRGK